MEGTDRAKAGAAVGHTGEWGVMHTDLSPYYPLIGELCIKCGAVEFELDRFLFGASELYGARLTEQTSRWPQQATAKRSVFEFIFTALMQHPPLPARFGFVDIAEVKSVLKRLYDVRNLVFHGTPVTGGWGHSDLEFARVTRSSKGGNKYCFSAHRISLSELEELLGVSDKLILFLDACICGLREERGGWLAIDLTVYRQIVKDNLAAEAKNRRIGHERTGSDK